MILKAKTGREALECAHCFGLEAHCHGSGVRKHGGGTKGGCGWVWPVFDFAVDNAVWLLFRKLLTKSRCCAFPPQKLECLGQVPEFLVLFIFHWKCARYRPKGGLPRIYFPQAFGLGLFFVQSNTCIPVDVTSACNRVIRGLLVY